MRAETSVLNVNFFCFSDLRSTLNAQGAHAVHAHLTHIHALVADLDHATLEVLLVKHVHLEGTDAHTHELIQQQCDKIMES